MKHPFRFFNAAAACGALILATLLACSGGVGPGSEGVVGGPMDGMGNYAAGPMSLPAPSIINKGLIRCENIPGPPVLCRGSDGAVPANSRVKLTVYARDYAASRHWSDWLVPGAHAIPGNTDFCTANGAGAFGQAGDCSVIASTGEKIGICVAVGNECVSATVLLTVPVEGGVVDGSTATIKSMATTPDGSIIFGRRTAPVSAPKSAFRWSSLLFGTAHAQDAGAVLAPAPAPAPAGVPAPPPPVPAEGSKLTLPHPVAAQCLVNPNVSVDLASAYKAPEGEWLTIKAQKGDGIQEMFKIPGTQDDLQTINANNIGNLGAISVAMKNTLIIVSRESLRPMAHIVFPAPIKSIGAGDSLEVYLHVPKGVPSLYLVKADTFETVCSEATEAVSLTRPVSLYRTLGYYTPPGDGFRVPQSFSVTGGVGEYEPTGEFHLVYTQQAMGNIPEYEGVIYRQTAPLKDFFILAVGTQKAQMAVLDPTANRILFFVRDLISGEVQTLPLSLAGVTSSPITMKLGKPFRGNPFLVVLDSGEQGAKAVMIPLTLSEDHDPAANLRSARSVDLGPIVADTLELNQPGMWQWATFDRIGGQVKTFVLGTGD